MFQAICKKKTLFPKNRDILICLILVLSVAAVYFQIRNHDFVNFDDDLYVFDNHRIKAGLTFEGVKWAFGFTDIAYWHPLTWLSHMLDCQLFGLNPGMHHLSNLIFHVLNSLLLYMLFKQLTGKMWPSALVAALFSLHPINVESVAWISERKNVLSTLFWILSLLTYIQYVKRTGVFRYLLTLIIFILGLMCKPALITLPFVLLLIDYWPLGRAQFNRQDVNINETIEPNENYFKRRPASFLVIEKIPFFMASVVSLSISIISAEHHGIMRSADLVPITIRTANALVSYLVYLGKLFWPQNLGVFYPFPNQISIILSTGAGITLLCMSFLFIWSGRKKHYLTVGWLWYVGTMVPHIGFIQGGLWPALADRWAYVPFIGIYIMIAWGAKDLADRWKLKKSYISTILMTLIIFLMFRTWFQVNHWANSVTLFEHNLNVTSNNHVAHNNLGLAKKENGNIHGAATNFAMAIQIKPDFELAYLNLGVIFAESGNFGKAIGYYKEALRIKPDYITALVNIGNVRLKQGRIPDAIDYYTQALKLDPKSALAYNGLGGAMVISGKYEKAVNYFQMALKLNPDSETIKNNLEKTITATGIR